MKDSDEKKTKKELRREQVYKNHKRKSIKKKETETLLKNMISRKNIIPNIKKLEIDEKIKFLYETENTTPFFVDVPLMNYFTYHGTIDSSDYRFQMAWRALFDLSNRIKYYRGIKHNKLDYNVYPMEIDWLPETSNEKYNWIMMIKQPELELMKKWHYHKEIEEFKKASKLEFKPFIENPVDKNLLYPFFKDGHKAKEFIKNSFLTDTDINSELYAHWQDEIAFESIEYGKCIQCLHLGDYSKMNATLEKITEYGKKYGYETDEVIHNIYLNDSRKIKSEKLKTIMRVKIIENTNTGYFA